MRAYTRTGIGHTDSESAQHLHSEKLSRIFLVLLTGFKPRVFGSRVRRSLPVEPPRQPRHRDCWWIRCWIVEPSWSKNWPTVTTDSLDTQDSKGRPLGLNLVLHCTTLNPCVQTVPITKRKARLCRVAFTDLGEFALAIHYQCTNVRQHSSRLTRTRLKAF